MKKIFKIASLLLAVAMISQACSEKLLDIPQQGVQSEDNSYITDDDCMSAVAAMYSMWRSVWSGCGYRLTNIAYPNMFWAKNLLGDDITTNARIESELANMAATVSNQWVEAIYNGLYKLVYYSNIITDKFTDESETKARAIAEAKFFKALSYYELITLWGQVPLVDHVLAPEEYEIGPS
ncbi:MAG: RagB/SusD family nutrient uptake outer membrane protein, partial [Bacteroidales bacterium]|nr:RagB/SusD family nutrient uptake outer membrane protein [Bacteroidales bacterium]